MRITRFGMVILAAFAGIYGMIVGIILLLLRLCYMENYGIAYLSPFVDVKQMNIKDTLLRAPVRFFKYRPAGLASANRRKQK